MTSLHPRKRTLLIVDDDEGPRKSLEIVFRNFYTVIAASNGHDALELIKTNTVDVAILDIHMPPINGLETTAIIRERFPSVEVLILGMGGWAVLACLAPRVAILAVPWIWSLCSGR